MLGKLYTVGRFILSTGEFVGYVKTGRCPTPCCYDNIASAKRICTSKEYGFLNRYYTYKVIELKGEVFDV